MEYQLQSIIESFFTYAGTSGWSYPSIVGCGENATILHYTVNSDQCNDGEIVLIDAKVNSEDILPISLAHGLFG